MKKLTGKTALVTGCGSALVGSTNGAAIAIALARAGAEIIGFDINDDALDRTRSIIEEEGGRCHMSVVDVTRSVDIKAAIERSVADDGSIDILVNNVGVTGEGGPIECTEERWRRDIDTNLTSMFLMCKFVLPYMERKGAGSIVNIGSISGVRSAADDSISYQASKAAILGLSRSVAIRYAHRNIRSNVIIAGIMNTPILAASAGDIPLEAFDRQCPMKHVGESYDVANAVLFLSSDDARYVTGAELAVDGGITARLAFDLSV